MNVDYSKMTNLKWVKFPGGERADADTGEYVARRLPSGKFLAVVDGDDSVVGGGVPTLMRSAKGAMEALHQDRQARQQLAARSAATVEPTRPGGQHEPSPTETPNPVARVAELERQAAERNPAPSKLVAKVTAARAVVQDTAAPHVIVKARAGTGKTTTLVSALKVMKGIDPGIVPSPQQQAVWDAVALSRGAARVGFCAFNVSIKEELARRVPAGCDVMTLHGLGNRAVRAAFGGVKLDEYRVSNIISEIMEIEGRRLRKEQPVLLQATDELVRLAKMNLTDPTPDELDALAAHYEVETNGCRDRVFALVPKVLDRCKDVNKDRSMNFDDMVWLPVALGLPTPRYDLLMVDEAQDLNRCQQALAKASGKRLVLCGDDRQAIYGFAGADSESLYRMIGELGNGKPCLACRAPDPNCPMCGGRGCVGPDGSGVFVLPLTVTRRCGKAIVQEAREIVPDFEAHESNGDGLVTRAAFDPKIPKTYREQAADGDMVVCRCNAPLVSECFRFLRQGRKANIQGRDVGRGLTNLVNKLCPDEGHLPVERLIERLGAWLEAENRKEAAKANPSENKMIALQDKHDCLVCFTDGAVRVSDVLRKIEEVFTDDKNRPGIRLSSIHRAKGLEAHRVFLLEPEGATVPHPMAKSAWQRGQEMNLRYVAITRAIEELVYVS